jgi:hypothetical protein
MRVAPLCTRRAAERRGEAMAENDMMYKEYFDRGGPDGKAPSGRLPDT